MRIHPGRLATVVATAVLSSLAGISDAQLIGNVIDIDFEDGTAANAGLGPDGVLLGDAGEATVSDGALHLMDLNEAAPNPGLSIPFDTSEPSPFGGAQNFTISFDFLSDGGFGPLFQALGDTDDFEMDPPEAAGSITLGLSEDGLIIADAWYVFGEELEAPSGEPLNDGEWHNIVLDFSPSDGVYEIAVDDGEPLVIEESPFQRPADPLDRVIFGDTVLNADLAGEDLADLVDPCECSIDNIFSEVFPPPPPPALNLELDAATGAVSIVGTEEAEPIAGFRISSPSGNLDPENYTGVAGVFDLGGDETFDGDDSWQLDDVNAEEAIESDIPEDGADNGAAVAEGASFEVGGPGFWKALPFADMEVVATLADGRETEPGELTVVNPESLPLVGDIADDSGNPVPDGDIDVNDYVRLVEVFDDPIEELSGYDAYFAGDLDGTFFKNLEDFILFRDAYNDFNGAGAFEAMVARVSAPEPSGLLLFGCAGAVLALRRRRAVGAALAVVLACGVGAQVSYAQTTIFDYQFENDFSDSSGNTGPATVNLIGEFALSAPPTVSDGKAQFPGEFLSVLDVPLSGNPFSGATDFTLSLDYSSMGNTAGAGVPAGVVLFSSVDMADPFFSFSVYTDPEGSLAAEFIGSEGFVECFECGVLDGEEHSVEVIYNAPDDVEEPGSLAMKVDGSFVALNSETFVEMPDSTYLTAIGGHRQREETDEEFPTECFDGECFALEMQGAMDNVKLTDDASTPSVLRATADRETGEFLLYPGEYARDIVTIEIGAEEEGALVPENWNSLSDQNLDAIGEGDGESWDELTASDTQLVEGFLLGSTLLDAAVDDTPISLGEIYNVSNQVDFIEAFVGAINPLSGETENVEVLVELIGEPQTLNGDYNEDGVVDAADYVAWRDNVGEPEGTLANDPNEGPIGAAQYDTWLSNYGATLGSGEAPSTVPEPGMLALSATCLAGVVAPRTLRRRSRRKG